MPLRARADGWIRSQVKFFPRSQFSNELNLILMIEIIQYLRVEFGAEGRHLHALEEAINQLLRLSSCMCTGSIVYYSGFAVGKAQVLLDEAQELTKIVLVCTLAEEPNWLTKQRRDRAEHSLRHPMILEGHQIRRIRQLPGLLLARCTDEGGLVDVYQAPLGGQEVADE